MHLVPVLPHRGELGAPGVEHVLPCLLELDPAVDLTHVVVDLGRDIEVLVGVEAEQLLGRAHLVLAERRAVRLGGVDRRGESRGPAVNLYLQANDRAFTAWHMDSLSPLEMNPPDLPLPDLAAAVHRLGRSSVLVVGDVMLDRYVYGFVERISPEAPVPIIRIERDVAMPGGAGNVVRNLTALGAAVAFVAVIGDDQPGSDSPALSADSPASNLGSWLRAGVPRR